MLSGFELHPRWVPLCTVYNAVPGGSNDEGGLCHRISVKKKTELVLIPIIAVPEYTFFVFRR